MVDKFLREQADQSFLVPYGLMGIVLPTHLVFSNQSLWSFDNSALLASLALNLTITLLLFIANIKSLKRKRTYAEVTLSVRNAVIPIGGLRFSEILFFPRQGVSAAPWLWHLDNLLMSCASLYIVFRAKSVPNDG